MDSPASLAIVAVEIGLEIVMATDSLAALLNEADKKIGQVLAARVHAIVQSEKLGYYPALDYFSGHAGVEPELLAGEKALAARFRKRMKREVLTRLWPVFSSVRIERATTLAYTLPRITPSQPDALAMLAQHFFPNRVRLELELTTLDKLNRLESVEKFTEQKLVRNLEDVFESIHVGMARRRNPDVPRAE